MVKIAGFTNKSHLNETHRACRWVVIVGGCQWVVTVVVVVDVGGAREERRRYPTCSVQWVVTSKPSCWPPPSTRIPSGINWPPLTLTGLPRLNLCFLASTCAP
ncbi:hypothetical protein Pcinc_011110 [Petrolisthes cinctipes]|uniref:Uncharacterized protein n=1 Tax=Petrolisthes cinctipes TaxID=88211 RepID=A0AAE1G476_PETCI|nr:hypothetical protein Pcinc_011110 [Petrolisthes cinctipes]